MSGDEYTIVERPYDPETMRKKRLREPEETIAMAREVAPRAVVHSEGHVSDNAARSAVKRIHAGQFGAWREYHGRLHAYVIPYDDGTWAVAVAWTEGENGNGEA